MRRASAAFPGTRGLAGVITTLLIAGVASLIVHSEPSAAPSVSATVPRPQLPSVSLVTTASTAPAPTTTTTTVAVPKPPRILFSETSSNQHPSPVFSVLSDGSGLTPAQGVPSAPVAQVSRLKNLMVYSKGLSSSSYSNGAVTCAFYRCTRWGSTSTEAGIAVSNLDGTGERQLTSGGYDNDPSFSLDGQTIAFTRHAQRPAGEIFDFVALMSVDGTILAALAPPAGFSYHSPAWAPDGKAIAVERTMTNEPAEQPGSSGIFVVPVDGAPAHQVTTGPFRQLAWSHDGRHLAAVRTRYEMTPWSPGDHPTGDDVWVVPIDGSPPTNITNLAPSGEPATYCEAYLSLVRATEPMWSPDDARVAFLASATNDAPGAASIGVVDTSGHHRTMVYNSPRSAHCDSHSGMSPGPPDEAVVVLGWS
jgi:hypothetical protein